MAHFDAREFLRASYAHRRRKVVTVSGVFLGAAAAAVLWIGPRSFDRHYLAQERRTAPPEATALGGTEIERPMLRPSAEPTPSVEAQDLHGGLFDLSGAFLLRPTLDPELAKEAQQKEPSQTER